MLLKRKLRKLSVSNTLKSVENVTYHLISPEELRSYFFFMIDHEFIKADTFEDNTWLFPDENKDRDIIFRFDLVTYLELNNALKSFILLKRMSGKTIGSCHSMLQSLKKAILHSNGLIDIKGLEAHLLKQSLAMSYRVASTIQQFLLFYEHPKSIEIIELCTQINSPERTNRDLPQFPDVITFDEYLSSFFDLETDENHIRFYPIYIWWKLTNIIPMRVIEFLKLKKKCVEKKDDHTFWITLPREKKKADSPFKIDVTDTIQITEDIYHIILKYVQIIDQAEIQTEYLLPYDLYVRYLPSPNRSSCQRKGTRNRLIDKYLQRIIDDFYQEIIRDDLLDRVKCGDTRHFAIMNMFLQGFNMLSIARMAGHDDLDTQFSYYSHADHYINSQVYLLAQQKYEQYIVKTIGKTPKDMQRYFYDKGLIYEHPDLSIFRQVEYGYCTDPFFPSNCVEDCRVCETYYIFKPPVNELTEGLEWLANYSEVINQCMRETADYMLCVTKSMYYDYKNLECQKTAQHKLTSASAQLTKLMDQMAIVEAQRMRYENE